MWILQKIVYVIFWYPLLLITIKVRIQFQFKITALLRGFIIVSQLYSPDLEELGIVLKDIPLGYARLPVNFSANFRIKVMYVYSFAWFTYNILFCFFNNLLSSYYASVLRRCPIIFWYGVLLQQISHVPCTFQLKIKTCIYDTVT